MLLETSFLISRSWRQQTSCRSTETSLQSRSVSPVHRAHGHLILTTLPECSPNRAFMHSSFRLHTGCRVGCLQSRSVSPVHRAHGHLILTTLPECSPNRAFMHSSFRLHTGCRVGCLQRVPSWCPQITKRKDASFVAKRG